MVSGLLLTAGVTLVLYLVYRWLHRNDDYFKERGIPHLQPTLLLGNTGALAMGRCTVLELSERIYKALPNERLIGFFDFTMPSYMVRDPELLRQMAIKDFDHFQDHSAMVDPKTDKLFGNGLLMLKGEEWREMRATMSPVFTGSKMRQMFELVSESANQMAQFLTKKLDAGETIDDEMRDLFMKYTNDTMASCAFGVKVNSFENENNEFLVAGKEAINFGKPSTLFRSFVVVKLPILAQLLNIQIFQSNFYKRVVLETMEERQKQNISRPDLINIFMGIRRGITGMSAASAAENKQIESNDSLATVEESHIGQMKVHRTWTDDQLVAQSFLFYFGGFDFIAGTMSLTSYALALNTDVQDKLYEEIREMNDRIDGRRLDYDSMQKMRYLDQVVCETLRMWPVIPTGDRMCVKDYVYDDGDLKFELKRGNVFTFPIYGFHHDEKYFSDPYTFNPDRFSAENKHNITPGTYLPFGVGPRNCIGSRLALMELKAVIYYLILNFSLSPNARTQIPLKFKKGSPVGLGTDGGVFIDIKFRKTVDV